MITKLWTWDKKISKQLCEILLDEISQMTPINGTVYGENDGKRKNKVIFFEKNHWFEGVLYNHIRHANQSSSWNFQIDDCQQLQVAIYEPGEKYDWHVDEDIETRQAYRYDGEFCRQRKLSAVCQISESSDFVGGGLFLKGIDDSVLKEQGDIVVFPSFLEHKAEEVKSGKRITIVAWATGEYWK